MIQHKMFDRGGEIDCKELIKENCRVSIRRVNLPNRDDFYEAYKHYHGTGVQAVLWRGDLKSVVKFTNGMCSAASPNSNPA